MLIFLIISVKQAQLVIPKKGIKDVYKRQVYIGADKYEIAAFDENAVSLRNPDFPLFGKELSRADFEEKLKENPANCLLYTSSVPRAKRHTANTLRNEV